MTYTGLEKYFSATADKYTSKVIERFITAFQPSYKYVHFPWESIDSDHNISYEKLDYGYETYVVKQGKRELIASAFITYFVVLWVMHEYSESHPLPCKAKTWKDKEDFHKAFLIFNRELKTYEQYRQALYDFCTTTDKGRLRREFIFSQEMFDGHQSMQKENWGVPVERGITQRERIELINGVFHITHADRGAVTSVDLVYDAELFYKTRLSTFMRLLFIS
ncbi:hypothetical protein KP803_20875 [Vibrio sp. ZSDE26]|uniref:Uncharacterized protein n=1 Tax=Vibrio amylolyticus TaxID=2847292 RepID=A0A9X2BJ45_9VIBR|nr:hypothetical protein [Vibrio amylolyticus]MCK6265716.1 hypothetical protein [Vibrio amylolyticus]